MGVVSDMCDSHINKGNVANNFSKLHAAINEMLRTNRLDREGLNQPRDKDPPIINSLNLCHCFRPGPPRYSGEAVAR